MKLSKLIPSRGPVFVDPSVAFTREAAFLVEASPVAGLSRVAEPECAAK